MPKTNAERQATYRASRLRAGLKELRNLWCHPEDEESVREFVAKLQAKRLGKKSHTSGGKGGIRTHGTS